MSSQDNDQDTRVVAVVLVAALLLAVGLALGFGISQVRKGGAQPVAAAAPTPTEPAAPLEAAPAAPVPSAQDASLVVDNGVVKFYFASGKAELASGALAALGDAVAAAKAGKRLVISGFHDTTGDPTMNAELAKQRAFAVRDALKGAGVNEALLELKKPAEAAGGTGADAEARRVEVVIAP